MTMLKDLLTGRLALVTGAGRGNGAAIARGLAEAGARVIVTDLETDAAHAVAESIVKAGGDARGHALDVTDHDGCRKLAEDLALLVGPIRILVNNAGIYLRGNMLAPDGRDRWTRTMAVNVDGAFNVTAAFAEQLKRTHGSVVNIASVNSFTAPAGSGVYPVTKGAIAQFTRALAVELAPDGVRVNAIAPGIIATAMTEVTRADPQRLQAFLNRVPLKRVGQPEELIGPVVFLCSDAASYVTGAILAVDGGFLAA
jgi:NAD(P)-dependent dehydrogenase (short-subunit alcohol dehydrogenase family)